MKTQSSLEIQPIQDLGDNSFYIHKNITKKVHVPDGMNAQTGEYWEADTVRIDNATLDQVTELTKYITL
jgi:hypothetical protein